MVVLLLTQAIVLRVILVKKNRRTIPPFGLANVKCFNFGTRERLRRDYPTNGYVCDVVCDSFTKASFAVHFVQELLSSMECEEQHDSGPVQTDFTDEASPFDDHCASIEEKVNDINEYVKATEKNMASYVLTHTIRPNDGNVVHHPSG